jgi:NAD-dependent DNA ligase
MGKSGDELLLLTSRARTDKAMSTLKGIILGVIADGKITQEEIDELKSWVELHQSDFLRNPFNELLQIIQNLITKGAVDTDELEDVYWLCQKYESDNYYYSGLTTDLQELQGYCHGLLSDGVINDIELKSLNSWINNHEHLNGFFPYDELRSVLLSITKDGLYTKEEKVVLESFFTTFIQLQNAGNIDAEYKQSISTFCTSMPNVVFEGKVFCLTGEFKSHTREEMRNEITFRGGIVASNVNGKTDFLIVGDSGNKAWAFACYGRKVEQAIAIRKAGGKIVIVNEYDFVDEF